MALRGQGTGIRGFCHQAGEAWEIQGTGFSRAGAERKTVKSRDKIKGHTTCSLVMMLKGLGFCLKSKYKSL